LVLAGKAVAAGLIQPLVPRQLPVKPIPQIIMLLAAGLTWAVLPVAAAALEAKPMTIRQAQEAMVAFLAAEPAEAVQRSRTVPVVAVRPEPAV
jgi:hypothetical protein